MVFSCLKPSQMLGHVCTHEGVCEQAETDACKHMHACFWSARRLWLHFAYGKAMSDSLSFLHAIGFFFPTNCSSFQVILCKFYM